MGVFLEALPLPDQEYILLSPTEKVRSGAGGVQTVTFDVDPVLPTSPSMQLLQKEWRQGSIHNGDRHSTFCIV